MQYNREINAMTHLYAESELKLATAFSVGSIKLVLHVLFQATVFDQ